jgi:3',5'-cyclic AMP phosphodiesterase CpdA
MTTIRILHISDLHLAEQPNLRSIIDRASGVKTAVTKTLLSDIKETALKDKPYKIWSAFEGLLKDENVRALRMALKRPTKQQVNDAIDEVLSSIVLGDGSFKRLVAQVLKEQTFASSFDTRLLYCLCNFIEDEEPQLHAIIITGDLATTGLYVDLERALSFIEGPLNPTIAIVPDKKKLVLPGNHDRFIYTEEGFLYAPGGSDFDEGFHRYWDNPVTAYEPLRSGSLSVIIIGADLGLQSKDDCTFPLLKLSRLAQGRVYTEILAQLMQLTNDLRNQEQRAGYVPVVMWAVHFPPFFGYQNAGWFERRLNNVTKNLIDEKLLVRAAKKNGVQAILAGHTHEAQDYATRKSGVRVLCAGSATQDDPGDKQCQMIRVTLDPANRAAISVVEYQPDMSGTTFRPK